MTRIEQPVQQSPVNREEMKQIVRRELFLEIFRRKIFGCLGYAAIALVILLVPAVFIVGAAAKSGLVNVPAFSSWLYKPSTPTRVIRPFADTTTEDVLRSVGRRASYDIRTSLAKVTVTETELTTIVADAAAQASSSKQRNLKDVQVVLEPRVIEFYAVVPQGEESTTILARITPSVVKGKLEFDVQSLHVGALAVAPSIAQLGASYLANLLGDALQQELSSAGSILDINVGIGELVITLAPDPKK